MKAVACFDKADNSKESHTLHAERQAEMTWEGNLAQGKGMIRLGSGAVEELPMTWAARAEQPGGKTSPEELIAAAHAGCYAMALALTLAEAGKQLQRVQVTAACILEEVAGKPRITRIDLEVRSKVPGLDAADFERAARQAEQLCPVPNALRNNVAIQLNAHLESEQPCATAIRWHTSRRKVPELMKRGYSLVACTPDGDEERSVHA
ncbi:MAG: OsmC family peroxiredoxin [Ktedonobacteraceae bacterium]